VRWIVKIPHPCRVRTILSRARERREHLWWRPAWFSFSHYAAEYGAGTHADARAVLVLTLMKR
jgi:hypothetical protein